MLKTKYPACCAKNTSKAIHFVDLSAELDRSFYAIAQLCRSVSDPEALDIGTTALVGVILSDLLERRICLEHFFWGRELRTYPIEPARIEAEMTFLRARMRRS